MSETKQRKKIVWLVRKRYNRLEPWRTLREFSSQLEAERWRKEERSQYIGSKPSFRVVPVYKDNEIYVFQKKNW